MPALKLKNFSSLSFLQGIDKPRYLRPLLEPFAEFFARQGVDVTALDNSDETDRKLLEIFTQPDEDMPPVLQETLFVLDDLADESGYERILDELDRLDGELDVEVVGDDLTPGELAIAVLQQQPHVIATCHAKIDSRKIKNYREFQSPNHSRLGLRRARRSRQKLERELSPWFASRGRSSACEVYVYQEEGEVKFQITHGKPYRSDGSIDKRLRRSRITYRPQKHDSVVYNNRTGVLKVSARWPKEIEQYRRTFGEVLFRDPEHFPPGRGISSCRCGRRSWLFPRWCWAHSSEHSSLSSLRFSCATHRRSQAWAQRSAGWRGWWPCMLCGRGADARR